MWDAQLRHSSHFCICRPLYWGQQLIGLGLVSTMVGEFLPTMYKHPITYQKTASPSNTFWWDNQWLPYIWQGLFPLLPIAKLIHLLQGTYERWVTCFPFQPPIIEMKNLSIWRNLVLLSIGPSEWMSYYSCCFWWLVYVLVSMSHSLATNDLALPLGLVQIQCWLLNYWRS